MGQAVVVFDAECKSWYSRFLHKHVNHCYLCVADRGKWLTVEPTQKGLNVHHGEDLPKGTLYCKVSLNNINWRPFFPSCVGLVKHMCGINKPFIFTPWQLYNYLRGRYEDQGEKA